MALNAEAVTIAIGDRQGVFAGMTPTRRWSLRVADQAQPRAVAVNGQELPTTAWSHDPARAEVVITGLPATARVAIRR